MILYYIILWTGRFALCFLLAKLISLYHYDIENEQEAEVKVKYTYALPSRSDVFLSNMKYMIYFICSVNPCRYNLGAH